MSDPVSNTANEVLKKASEATPFCIGDYTDWFEKININTIIWQLIALIVIFSFRSEIKAFLQGVVAKIPQLKSIGPAEFILSEETKEAVGESSERLQKEIQVYEEAVERDPNIVFLTIFIEIESKLSDLYSHFYQGTKDISFIRPTSRNGLQSLVRQEVLDPRVLSLFADIRSIRNGIAHGEKPLKSMKEAEPYFKVLLLLRDIVSEGHRRFFKNNTNEVGLTK